MVYIPRTSKRTRIDQTFLLLFQTLTGMYTKCSLPFGSFHRRNASETYRLPLILTAPLGSLTTKFPLISRGMLRGMGAFLKLRRSVMAAFWTTGDFGFLGFFVLGAMSETVTLGLPTRVGGAGTRILHALISGKCGPTRSWHSGEVSLHPGDVSLHSREVGSRRSRHSREDGSRISLHSREIGSATGSCTGVPFGRSILKMA